jgi:hypothetical protein
MAALVAALDAQWCYLMTAPMMLAVAAVAAVTAMCAVCRGRRCVSWPPMLTTEAAEATLDAATSAAEHLEQPAADRSTDVRSIVA